MATVFIVCAAIGGTILVLQFALGLFGLGGHALDLNVPHDVPHDFGGDFHGDAIHGGAEHDFHGDDAHTGDDAHHGGTTWLFRILSFRAVVAALAFFGLAGLAAQSAGASVGQTLAIAVAAGAVAMTVVYWMMRAMQELRAEGTVRIQRAIGQPGSVYLRVPGNNSGCGKIQLSLQNRTVEYLAVTFGPELPTGTKVVVLGVVDPTTLEIEAE